MVCGRVYRRKLVGASRKTSGDIRGKNTTHGCLVQTLEESELGGIDGRGLIDRGQRLDDDVRVTDNLALGIKLLRRGKIVFLRINEVTGLHPLYGHRDGKPCVRREDL